MTWAIECASDQRWVCGACGRYTEPGARRDTLRDTACVQHAVLCRADKLDGAWHAVAPADNITPGVEFIRYTAFIRYPPP